MGKIETIYGSVFENILGEKVSTKPVEVVDPFPWNNHKLRELQVVPVDRLKGVPRPGIFEPPAGGTILPPVPTGVPRQRGDAGATASGKPKRTRRTRRTGRTNAASLRSFSSCWSFRPPNASGAVWIGSAPRRFFHPRTFSSKRYATTPCH